MRSRTAVGALLALALAALAPAARGADFAIAPDSFQIRTLDAAGLPDNRAGAHPDRLQVEFAIDPGDANATVKDVSFEFPPGLAGDASAVPACAQDVYENGGCPESTEVGTFGLQVKDGGPVETVPLLNIQPPPGRSAEFGTFILFFKTPIVVRIRPTDYGLTLSSSDLVQLKNFRIRIELWGVPADHYEGSDPVLPRRAFLTTPARCGPMTAAMRVRSWQPGAPWLGATTASPPLEGCQALPFEPRLGMQLTDPAADVSTGVQTTLSFPEYDDPDGLIGSNPRTVSIRFPDGMSVSPAGAASLAACSDLQFGLGSEGAPTCPPASRVGTVSIESPQVEGSLSGGVFLGQEQRNERFRLFVAAAGGGVELKLTGSLRADPATGQLTARLGNLPQIPFTRMALDIDGGPRGLLASPLSCGRSKASASFDPYGEGAPVESSQDIVIRAHAPGAQCSSPPFAPKVTAGSTEARAGRRTSFAMTLRREDGEQLPDRFSVELPAGLSPAVRSVGRCDAVAAATASCPDASRVGTTVAEFGSGPNPATLTGDAYLTGPYKRAPFGLAMVFDAAIGPFQLGKLTVRGKVSIDSLSGRATLETDSLPEAFEGIPLRFQTIGLDLDRPGFLHNPTSCAATEVRATVWAKGGASAGSTTPFALKGCNSLGFRPTFAMRLSGRSQLHRHGKPGLRITARLPRGNSNLRTIGISLPRLLKFDLGALTQLCSRTDALRDRCPATSRVGSSRARTPLLADVLGGPVYVVQPKGDGSPDLWASVEGSGVHLNLRGKTASKHGRAVVTLTGLPDMPLSTLAIRLDGGEDGALSLAGSPCRDGHARRIVAPISAEGQDGAFGLSRVRVAAASDCDADAPKADRARRPTRR